MPTIVAVIVALLSGGCQQTPSARATVASALGVRLDDLLANPATYDGRVVRTVGYFNLEFEGTALFLRREDAEEHLAKRSVWLKVGWPVSDDRRQLGNAYVQVQGTFEAPRAGSVFSGELKEITKMERWP
jgi:hypothetical protein